MREYLPCDGVVVVSRLVGRGDRLKPSVQEATHPQHTHPLTQSNALAERERGGDI